MQQKQDIISNKFTTTLLVGYVRSVHNNIWYLFQAHKPQTRSHSPDWSNSHKSGRKFDHSRSLGIGTLAAF